MLHLPEAAANSSDVQLNGPICYLRRTCRTPSSSAGISGLNTTSSPPNAVPAAPSMVIIRQTQGELACMASTPGASAKAPASITTIAGCDSHADTTGSTISHCCQTAHVPCPIVEFHQAGVGTSHPLAAHVHMMHQRLHDRVKQWP
eukprot:scaffold365125_cov28-Prasinocladus_malaysianus.AAC.1